MDSLKNLSIVSRWKQEFDTETNEETKEEGRARTKDEQHLSVEEFNEIRLNELNTKGRWYILHAVYYPHLYFLYLMKYFLFKNRR